MANWKSKAVAHYRINGVFFQVNYPVNNEIMEFEIVVFRNGVVSDRVLCWEGSDSPIEICDDIAFHPLPK